MQAQELEEQPYRWKAGIPDDQDGDLLGRRHTPRIGAIRPGGSRLALIIIGIGLVVIGIGWNGAAGAGGEINHVPVVQAQLPWLLSGGFLGLGIVVLGAAMLIANSYRESESRIVARLEEALRAAAGSGQRPGDGNGLRRADLVVAGSESYHRPDCRLARGRTDAPIIDAATATTRGLHACRICHPAVT